MVGDVLGLEGDDRDALFSDFEIWTRALFSVPVALPGSPFARALQARARLLDRLQGVLERAQRQAAAGEPLAGGLDLELGTLIRALQRGEEGGWTLVSEQPLPDETYEIVLVAVPAEQAVSLLSPAPRLQAAAATVRMQPCWAVMLAFDYDLDLPFDAAFPRGGPVLWAANNGRKPGRPAAECWLLHATPAWSREHVEDEPEAVVAPLMEAFFQATGCKPLRPLFAKAHRWRHASPENPLGVGFLWDAGLGLGACGDWCHSARAEGAFLSGLQLAERILAERPRARP